MKSSTNRGGHNANPLFSAFLKALLSVMLLLVGNVAVKAQTEGSDFTFEEGRCYSKWVINSRIGKFNANTTKMGFATFDEKGTLKTARDDGNKTRLDYVPGLVAKGVIEAAQYYSQYPWAKPWFLSIADFGDKWYETLPGGETPTDKEFEGGGSLDDINGFKLYITLYELAKDGGAFADANIQSHAENAINNAIKGLKDHNTNYAIKEGTQAGNDVVGGWFHKKAYNNQMWLDGQYMGPALLAQIINYNNKTNNVSTDDWKTIIKQLDIVWKQCWNETDRLLYHAFEANGGTGTSNSHADLWEGLSANKFHSASYWGRACGWYFLALVDILAEMDKANLSSNPTYSADYTRIQGYLTSLAAGLKAKKDADTGGWYQILDKNGTFSASVYDNGKSHTATANYIESSATAIFAAAYLKAIRLGYLSEADYGETATNAYKCIVNNFFAKDGEGVHIFGSCRSAGLGSDKTDGTWAKGKANFRDGSNAYYLLGSDVTRVEKSENITEGKVLGAFILAATEYERLHTTLVQDLPATSTVGTALKLGLSGIGTANDALSYKWYNTNDEATAVATTEEFAPTEAGTYKCVVEVTPKSDVRANNSYTITSKEVTVSATTEEPTTPSDNVGTIVWNFENATAGNFTAGNTYTYKDTQNKYDLNYVAGSICKIESLSSTETVNGTGYNKDLSMGGSSSDGKNRYFTFNAPSDKGKITIVCSAQTAGGTATVTDGTSSVTLSPAKGGAKESGVLNTTKGKEIKITFTEKCRILSIIWTPETTGGTTYTVTYNANGKEVTVPPTKSNVTSLTQAMLDETPGTVEGWTFKGWYTEAACTNKATAIETLTGDVNLYAKWTINTYTVTPSATNGTISINGTDVTSATSYDYGTKLVFKATPANGYEFVSWTVDGTQGTEAADHTYTIASLDKGTKVTATFKEKQTTPSTGESQICNFKGSTPSTPDMVEKVAGTYSTAKGSVTYKEKTYGTCLKMESSTDLKITLAESRLVTFVFKESSKRIEINGTLYTTDTNGWITLTLEKGESHIKKGKGDAINLFAIDFGAASKSNETITTFTTEAEHSLSADGKTFTITHEHTDTGDKTITVAKASGATYKLTAEDGTSEAVGASLTGDVITYTVPAVNTTKTYKLNVVAEDKTTTAEYTIKITTKPAPGSMAEYTATFTLDQLKTFGSRTTDIGEITSADNALTLKAVAGTKSGKNVEADKGGAKMQTTSSFILTPTAGVKIKKVSVFTNQSGRHLTSNPSTDAVQSTADNKMWEYTFNSIEEAITFTNANTDNITVSSINVVYEKAAGDGKTALSAKFSKDMIEWYVNDAMPELPTLTVTAIGVENYTDYTVEFSSSDANVVKVDAATGALAVVEGIAGGSASITAVVTPTDANADNYVSTSTLYTVNIKPLKEPVVSVQDMTIYNTVGVHPQPVVTVYVRDEEGNDIVLDPRYYTLSYTPISGDILESSKQGDFILAGSAGNWTTGSAVVRVTCSPEDEARTLYHIMEADATFNVNVVAVGDKLIPTLGGVTKAKMNAGTTREFVKSVLYNSVDITSGFNCEYTVTDTQGVTGCKVSKKENGILSFTAGTLNTGVTEGKATITITATPNTDNEEQYMEITGIIDVTIGKYTDFKSVTLNPSEIEVNVGDVLQNFEVVVLDESGNEVPEDDYTMIWGSSAPGIVGLVGDGTQGIFNAVSEGQAIVRVYIQKDGYADMKGECVVTVKDPGKYAVPETLDVKIGDELKADGLTLTLGGWMFKGNPDLSSYNATTETFGNASVKWGSPAKDNNKPVGFTHNITMKDQKNARQEFGSNCQPESYGIYNGTIKEQTTKVLDPMFNVPCYGAYFALAPKTTGRVTVYVRQNGVFDDDTSDGRSGKGVYRPQRRVFVMDEMGGFVSSTPELVYPTPWKPETATLKDFDCDLFDLKAADKKDITQFTTTDDNIQTPEDWIKSHFLGLQSFTMSKTNFKNGVYASNLPTDVTHNQAQINRTDKDGNVTDISARGWSVLSVAPVSYTFDVKPGKTYYIYNYGSKLGLYGFVFRKGSPTVDEKVWSQNSTPEISVTEENHVAKVSIDREFKAGIWNACVLPFSMNRQQIGNVFGPCDDKNNPGGTQILYFDHTEGSTIHFVRHAYNTIVAGKPFLIKPTKDAVISSENMGEFPYVTIESTSAENFGKDKENASYYWTSSYAPFTVAPGDYFLRDTEINGKPADGNIVRYPKTMTEELKMYGFRGYLTAKTNDLRQSAKSLTIAINDFESDETTYIENVEIAEDGTLRQRLSGKVYNLQGQLVSNDASQLDSLPKGIYIVNGTKVSVK